MDTNFNFQSVENKNWNNFVQKLNKNTFLHSLEWAEFNSDHKVFKVGLYKGEELLSIALIIKIVAKRGRFLLVPHGPQYSLELDLETEKNILISWKNYLAGQAKKEDCCFVRVQPILKNDERSQRLFNSLGFKHAPMHMHTELTTLLDISKSEEEILLNMRKTTRQMIRKGEKMIANGEVEIEFPKKITAKMHEIYEQTYKRGGAVAYSRDYIEKECEIFSKRQNAKLIVVKYQNEAISWGLVIISGKRAFYHQGGNILLKNVPGSYLVQWKGIQFAKEKNCQTYDFWGVSPEEKKDHPWTNISLFKRGFGGEDVDLLHAQDLVINWRYWINWLVEKQRARKRGFN